MSVLRMRDNNQLTHASHAVTLTIQKKKKKEKKTITLVKIFFM